MYLFVDFIFLLSNFLKLLPFSQKYGMSPDVLKEKHSSDIPAENHLLHLLSSLPLLYFRSLPPLLSSSFLSSSSSSPLSPAKELEKQIREKIESFDVKKMTNCLASAYRLLSLLSAHIVLAMKDLSLASQVSFSLLSLFSLPFFLSFFLFRTISFQSLSAVTKDK